MPMHVLALLHQKFPTDAGSLTGLSGGEKGKKFSYGSKQNQTRDEKVSDLHIANEKGSPTPCAGVMQMRKRVEGGKGGKKKKGEISIWLGFTNGCRSANGLLSNLLFPGFGPGWRPLTFNLSPAPGPKWDVPIISPHAWQLSSYHGRANVKLRLPRKKTVLEMHLASVTAAFTLWKTCSRVFCLQGVCKGG